jgi:hypothetical protein
MLELSLGVEYVGLHLEVATHWKGINGDVSHQKNCLLVSRNLWSILLFNCFLKLFKYTKKSKDSKYVLIFSPASVVVELLAVL